MDATWLTPLDLNAIPRVRREPPTTPPEWVVIGGSRGFRLPYLSYAELRTGAFVHRLRPFYVPRVTLSPMNLGVGPWLGRPGRGRNGRERQNWLLSNTRLQRLTLVPEVELRPSRWENWGLPLIRVVGWNPVELLVPIDHRRGHAVLQSLCLRAYQVGQRDTLDYSNLLLSTKGFAPA